MDYIQKYAYNSETEYKVNQDTRILEGYASVTGNVDDGGDLIESGAYKSTLRKHGKMVAHVFNHDMDKIVGPILELKEDSTGLYFKTKVSETPLGNDVLVWAADKALKGNSVGMWSSRKDMTWHDETNKGSKGQGRTLHKIQRLIEITTATVPMNRKAKLTGVKKSALLIELLQSVEGFELKHADATKLKEAASVLIELADALVQDEKSLEPDTATLSLREQISIECGLSSMHAEIYAMTRKIANQL